MNTRKTSIHTVNTAITSYDFKPPKYTANLWAFDLPFIFPDIVDQYHDCIGKVRSSGPCGRYYP